MTTVDDGTFIKERLLSTKREGIEYLIDYMEEIGFFTSPCSSQYHLACESGLVKHTRNVVELAEKIGVSLLGGAKYNKIQNSVIISAILHDLGKCGDFGKAFYVPNILKSGKVSDAKPYERNKELTNVPHGIRSVIIANRFIDLTEDEEYAIMFHDGLYEPSNVSIIKGHETQLFLIIHYADMWASHVTEIEKEEE